MSRGTCLSSDDTHLGCHRLGRILTDRRTAGRRGIDGYVAPGPAVPVVSAIFPADPAAAPSAPAIFACAQAPASPAALTPAAAAAAAPQYAREQMPFARLRRHRQVRQPACYRAHM